MNTKLRHTVAIFTVLLLAHYSVPPAAQAEHNMTCHQGTGGNLQAVWITVGFFEAETNASLMLFLGRGGSAAHAVIRDGLSNTIFFGEIGPVFVCADPNQNGILGVTEVEVSLSERRSREPGDVTILIVPQEREVDTTGWHEATAWISRGAELLEMEGMIHVVSSRRPAVR